MLSFSLNPMGLFSWLGLLLFFFNLLCSLSSPLSPPTPLLHHPLCHPYESSALLGFKNSFPIINLTCYDYNSSVSWDMGRDCCTWSGVTCDDVTGHVIGLHLQCGGLRGVINSNNSLFSLSHLQTLNLSENDFEGSAISPEFGRFAGLVHLDLSLTNFTGQVPPELACLSNLVTLDLSSNHDLRADSFSWNRIIKNLTSLKKLSLSYSGFLIDLPFLTRNLKHLNALDVADCNIRGSFPAILYNLTHITYLDLSGNNFTGPLPEVCSNSTKKTFLCDSSNDYQLVGPIPLNLKYLDVSRNNLNGTIPTWLYSLPYLQWLDLEDNQITGQIGEFQYNSLTYLDLSSNKLHDIVPTSIFQQVNLFSLDLSSNSLSGVVMLEQISNLKNLYYLSFSFNNLSVSSISHANYSLPNLRSLEMSSCNIREFPYSLRSLDNLESLDLSNSRLEGSVPQWLWNVGKDSLRFLNLSHNFLTHMGPIPRSTRLEYIDLQSNQLQGHLPIPPPSTIAFSISNNKFVGEISSSLCNLSSIEVLDLSNNSFSGRIPPCVGNLSSLSVLDLRMNNLRGTIPPTFAKGSSLRTLNLNRNQLEGSLPQSLVNCKILEVLDVGNNKMNGSFPFWLESLPELQVLILRSNRFLGPIRNYKARFPFQKLRIIDLSNNEFTGTLPIKFFENFLAMMDAHMDYLDYMGGEYMGERANYHDSIVVTEKGFDLQLEKILTIFIAIDFSRNSFEGEIPECIGKLKSLKGLNVSHNKLVGPIPTLLGNLSNLEWLDLSSNELVGKIPWQLAANLNQLEFLNLSNNRLEGPIPGGKQFDTFNNDSYDGNPELCGLPLSKSCNERTAEHKGGDGDNGSGMFDWKVVMMGYASGVVIGLSLGYMVLFNRRFDHWLAKRIGRGPQRRHKTDAGTRGRGKKIARSRNQHLVEGAH